MNRFTERLQMLLVASGKRQTKVSAELGISKQKLTNWKSGYTEPNLDDMMMLAKYFDVTIDYLVGLENEDGTRG